MFDDRFKKGIVFRIDADAAKDSDLTEGDEFAISRNATAVEIRASRFRDGKPARGRPRKFPTTLVARLLGITDLAAVTTPVASDNSDDGNEGDSAEDEARVESLIASTTSASSDDEESW